MRPTETEPCVPIDRDFEDMLLSAVRYALGRQTCITSITSKYVTRLLPYLSDRAICMILHNIEKADDLGNPIIDAPNWLRLAGDIRDELERREKNATD